MTIHYGFVPRDYLNPELRHHQVFDVIFMLLSLILF